MIHLPRLRGRGAALLAGLLLLGTPAVAAAQNPPVRPDTLPRPAPADTVRVEGRDTTTFQVPPGALPADTIPVQPDTAAVDSIVPAPVFPAYPQPDSAGFWQGTWVWDRAALERFHGMSLLELLNDVPGVTVFRGGGWGQPAGVAPWGLGGGRMRFFYDGWEVDPLASATLDLQEISLTELEEVRVERRLGEIRVEVLPFRLPDRRPYSQIELGTGELNTRLLRGLFATAVGARQTVTVGADIADTDGYLRREPFAANNLFARWAYRFNPGAGVQVEYRSTDLAREDTAFIEDAERRALWLRGRYAPTRAFAVDAMLGRNWRIPADRDRFPETAQADQAALRALLQGGFGWVEGTARLRREVDGYAFPVATSDLGVRAGLRPGAFLEVQGSARATTRGGDTGTELEGSVRLGPATGLSVFGSVTAGTRGVGVLTRDSVFTYAAVPRNLQADTFPLFETVSPTLAGVRAGAQWSRPGALVGASLVRLDADLAAPFGLRLDDDLGRATPAEASTGIESYVSVPLFRPFLRLEGWYTRWTDTGGLPYLPDEQGRAALEYHDVFYRGNLEPTVRVEVVRRGSALVPRPLGADGEVQPPLAATPHTLVNAFLQIRVIDVRAFLRVENLLDLRGAADLPGHPLPGVRAVYGVRWHFRN
jgi:hypothetical protein